MNDTIANATTVSYNQLINLIKRKQLKPCTCYKVTGFNKNMPIGTPSNPHGNVPESLYDDGTNPGVTVYVKAITNDTLSNEGYGEFFNPNYYTNESDYFNTDGTGFWGIWQGQIAVDINNVPLVYAPNYQNGQVVFWGGYAWQYNPQYIGQLGVFINDFELDPDCWQKLSYQQGLVLDRPAYVKVIDKIKIDWRNYRAAIITERYNEERNIRVSFSLDSYKDLVTISQMGGLKLNPISHMGWGIYGNIATTTDPNWVIHNIHYGIKNIECDGSFVTTVNFLGSIIYNLKVSNSFIIRNVWGRFYRLINNSFDNYSFVIANVFLNGSLNYASEFSNNKYNKSVLNYNKIGDFKLNSISSFSSVYASRISNCIDNKLNYYCNIGGSLITGNGISKNNLEFHSSLIFLTTREFCNFSNNKLSHYSVIENSGCGDVSEFKDNTLHMNSRMINLQVGPSTSGSGAGSINNNNVLTNGSILRNIGGGINNCRFWKAGINFPSYLQFQTSKILNINGKDAIWTTPLDVNLTYQVQNLIPKEMFKRQDGTIKISYINNSDALVVLNFDAI